MGKVKGVEMQLMEHENIARKRGRDHQTADAAPTFRPLSRNTYGAASGNQIKLSTGELKEMNDATAMLAAIKEGDRDSVEQLLSLVYDELRRLAASKLAHEAPGQTLQPTALVHEAWLRLVGDHNRSFKDRTHF